ncbi:hypothetical protein [Nostoc sp.]|uniref:hypothetical protein n=1 Tax=Nostoc sp. TaxID=1180 RepID=UPI002FFAE27A
MRIDTGIEAWYIEMVIEISPQKVQRILNRPISFYRMVYYDYEPTVAMRSQIRRVPLSGARKWPILHKLKVRCLGWAIRRRIL